MKERLFNWIKSPKKVWNYIVQIATYILLFDIAFVFIFPFLYVMITSLKTNADLSDFTVNWVPKTIKLQNYLIALKALSFFTYLKNSVFVTVVATIGHLLSCSFIGYGFARYKFPGKNILFLLVIVAFVVPVQTIIVPLYIEYSHLQWLNTFLPVIVPAFFGYGLKGALFIFVFRQFYLGLPPALEEAARIDGCSFIKVYWKIVLPVVQSAFLITLVLSIVWHWNDFYEPSIYAIKPAMALLPSRLNVLVNMVNAANDDLFQDMVVGDGENVINNAVLMAGTFMVILPILVSFGFIQKRFMQGIERTGIVE